MGRGITANSLSGSSTCRILDKSTYPVENWKSWNIFLMGIAQELNISANTVEFHRHNLMSKLHVNNVAQMVKKAMQMGLEFIMG